MVCRWWCTWSGDTSADTDSFLWGLWLRNYLMLCCSLPDDSRARRLYQLIRPLACQIAVCWQRPYHFTLCAPPLPSSIINLPSAQSMQKITTPNYHTGFGLDKMNLNIWPKCAFFLESRDLMLEMLLHAEMSLPVTRVTNAGVSSAL